MNGCTLLRRARPADRNRLLPLIEAYCKADAHAFDRKRVESALLPLLRDDRQGMVWLIGEPAQGYAVVTWGYSLESGGRDALLDEIYVAPQGAGLGGRALDSIMAQLGALGIRRIFLETESANSRGRRFYARHGFEVEDSVWMARDLPGP